MTKRLLTHLTRKNASKLHCQVLALLKETYPIVMIEQEFGFDVVADSGKKHHLYLDFYVPSLNLAVECQGEQHFHPNTFFSSTSTFAHRQQNDELKKLWCELNEIALITFRYDETINRKTLMKKIKEAIR